MCATCARYPRAPCNCSCALHCGASAQQRHLSVTDPFPTREEEIQAEIDAGNPPADGANDSDDGAGNGSDIEPDDDIDALKAELDRFRARKAAVTAKAERVAAAAADEQQRAHARATAAAATAAAAAAAGKAPVAGAFAPRALGACCPHCTSDKPPQDRLCPDCLLNGQLAVDHPINLRQNALFLARDAAQAAALAARASGGQSLGDGKTAAAAGAAAPSLLNRRDKELLRLATARDPRTTFALTPAEGRTTAEQAAELIRRSLDATAVEPPSEQLIKLIQSGNFIDVGFAIPRRVGDDRPDIAAADSVITFVDGRAKTVDEVRPPPINNMVDLMKAFFGTIAPALIGRDQALMDWMTLIRTMLTIQDKAGFQVAKTYMTLTLTEAARLQGVSIGALNREVYDTARSTSSASPPHQGGHGAGAGGTSGGAHTPRAAAGGRSCMNWNGGRVCIATPCPFPHICSLCGFADHPSTRCGEPNARATQQRTPFRGGGGSSYPSSQGGRGGARGGGGRGSGRGGRGGRGRGGGSAGTTGSSSVASTAKGTTVVVA